MKFLFRVDASLTIGTGHVMRCLALARKLKKNNCEIEFISRKHEGNIIKKIRENVEVGAITLGSKGSIVFQNQIEKLVTPIIVNDPVDTTGAGDIFASGFLFGLTNKYSIEDCGKLGSKVAADIIKYIGARPRVPLKTFLN